MPIRTERITNPDGTVTVKKTSGINVKHEADWGDEPHPDKKPHTGSSALDRKWEKAEDARIRRLSGHDGGPQASDIRSEDDATTATKTRVRHAHHALTGDPDGSWSQAGSLRAAEALDKMTPDERGKYFQSFLMGGADTGRASFADLYSTDYRAKRDSDFNVKYQEALYATPDTLADERTFQGYSFTGDDGESRSVLDVLAEDRKTAAEFFELTGQRMATDPEVDTPLYWGATASGVEDETGKRLLTEEQAADVRSEADLWGVLGRVQLGVEGITTREGYEAAVVDYNANVKADNQAAVQREDSLQDVALAEYREDLKWGRDIAEERSDRLAPILRDVALAEYREDLKWNREIAEEWSDRLAPSLRDVALADYRENLKSDRDIAEEWSDRLAPSLRDVALADYRENLKSDRDIAEQTRTTVEKLYDADSPVARAIWLEEMGYGDSDEMTDQVADALWMRVYPDYLDQARQWLDQERATERTGDILSQIRRGNLSNIHNAGPVWIVARDGSGQMPVDLTRWYAEQSPRNPGPNPPSNKRQTGVWESNVRLKAEDNAAFVGMMDGDSAYKVEARPSEDVPVMGYKDFTEAIYGKEVLQGMGTSELFDGNPQGYYIAQGFGIGPEISSDFLQNVGSGLVHTSALATVVGKEWAKAHPQSMAGSLVIPGETTTQAERALALLEAGLIAAPLAKPAVTTLGTGGRLAWQFPGKVAKGFTYRNPLTGEIMQQPYVVRPSGAAVPDVIPTVKLGGRGTDFIPITDQTFYRAQGELTDIGLGGNINFGETQYLGRGGQLSELPTSGYFADDAVAGAGQGFRQAAPEITVIEYGGPFAVTERALVNMPVRVARPGQIRAGNKALRFDMDPEDYIPDFDTVPVGEKDWGKIKPTATEMDDYYQNVQAGSGVMPGQGVGGQRFVSPMVLDPQTQVGPLGPSATVRVQRVYDVSPSGLAVPAPRLAALPAQQAGFPVPPTGTGAGLGLAGAPRGGFGTAPESAWPTFQNSFAPVPFSHIPAIRQGADTWQSLLPGLAPTTGPDFGVASEPAPAALSQGAIAPAHGSAPAPSSFPETVPTGELGVRQSLVQDVDLVTSIPQPPPMPVPQITTLNWALNPAPFTQSGSLGQFGGEPLGQSYEPHVPRPPSGRPPPPKGPPLARPSVRPSGGGYWPGLGSGPQGYPQEVAVVLPPTVAVIDLATGIERRHLTGADRDVSLLVTQVGPTPRPNRELIGPHVDVLTDQDGRVGRREARPVHHRVRAPRPQPPAAAKPKSGGQPRAQRLPSGPRIPRQIRQFARQANRNRR